MRGWYNPKFSSFLADLKEQQAPAASAEIGVFAGKSLIELYRHRSPGFPVLAVDTFKDCYPNKPSTRPEFEKNVHTALPKDQKDLVIIESDSQVLTAADYRQAAKGPIRVFHVDGCHYVNEVCHDLREALGCLSDDGVIIADDVFRPGQPEVSMALFQILGAFPGLTPIALAHNKVLLSYKTDWKWGRKPEYMIAWPTVTKQKVPLFDFRHHTSKR